MRQNAFEKTKLGEMLIEQIIEFESRVPGPLVVHILVVVGRSPWSYVYY